MDYTKSNKAAWEEAFQNRSDSWGADIRERLNKEDYPFLEQVLIDALAEYDLKDKAIAQFCCNNGRELLSLMKFGAERGVGFDIAENMISFANATAKELGSKCTFIATDILKIDQSYHGSFDYIFITIGALTWFENLSDFFHKAAQCLKPGGRIIINEMHPFTEMLGASGEANYDITMPEKIVNSYFRKEPWIENSGMGYISGKSYISKTFYSFSHTFSSYINALQENKMTVQKLLEYDYDISGMFAALDHRGIPLSFLLVAQKQF